MGVSSVFSQPSLGPSVPQSFDDRGEGLHEVIGNCYVRDPKTLPEAKELLAHLLRRPGRYKRRSRAHNVVQVHPQEVPNPLTDPILWNTFANDRQHVYVELQVGEPFSRFAA